jgi:hypothetical protein
MTHVVRPRRPKQPEAGAVELERQEVALSTLFRRAELVREGDGTRTAALDTWAVWFAEF